MNPSPQSPRASSPWGMVRPSRSSVASPARWGPHPAWTMTTGCTTRSSLRYRSPGTGSAPVAATTPCAVNRAHGSACWAPSGPAQPTARIPQTTREDAGLRRVLPAVLPLMGSSVGSGHRRTAGGQPGPQEVAVHPGDRVDADLLGAGLLTLAVEGAPAEPLEVH